MFFWRQGNKLAINQVELPSIQASRMFCIYHLAALKFGIAFGIRRILCFLEWLACVLMLMLMLGAVNLITLLLPTV